MPGTPMSYLLFPGRHLVNTVFQGKYLLRALSEEFSSMPGFMPGRSVLSKPIEVIAAGFWNKTVRIWNATSGDELLTLMRRFRELRLGPPDAPDWA